MLKLVFKIPLKNTQASFGTCVSHEVDFLRSIILSIRVAFPINVFVQSFNQVFCCFESRIWDCNCTLPGTLFQSDLGLFKFHLGSYDAPEYPTNSLMPWVFVFVLIALYYIESLTRDSINPGPTKTITQIDWTQLIQTHRTNNMTHRIKSNQTKRARTCLNRQNAQACDQYKSHV